MGFSLINHLFWGTSIYGNPRVVTVTHRFLPGPFTMAGGVQQSPVDRFGGEPAMAMVVKDRTFHGIHGLQNRD